MLIDAIAERAKVDPDSLRRIASNASRRYHEFPIPKRDGTTRIIAHPSRPLKALQRFLARNIFKLAPVHSTAMAYKKGSSIRINAESHLDTRFTIRLDFANFFPSFDIISVKYFTQRLCNEHSIPINDEDLSFITSIVCRYGALPIGAPSSPRITNAMLFEFDRMASEFCENLLVVYTRYADDIFISANDLTSLNTAKSQIELMVASHKTPKLRINRKKTLHLSKANHRSITGVVMTTDGYISIGRERKREIKTLTHLALENKLDANRLSYLSGLISYANDVEPQFIRNLGSKFGVNIMAMIKNF